MTVEAIYYLQKYSPYLHIDKFNEYRTPESIYSPSVLTATIHQNYKQSLLSIG